MTVGQELLIYLKTSLVAAVMMTANKLSVCGTICSNTTPKHKRACNVITYSNKPGFKTLDILYLEEEKKYEKRIVLK